MNITLLISISVLILGILAMFNYNKVSASLDTMLSRFGKAAAPMKYVLLAVGFVLFLCSLYSVVMWIKTGVTPSMGDSFADMGDDMTVFTEYNTGDAMNPEVPKDRSNLAAQTSKLSVVASGKNQVGVIGLSSVPDNLLERYYTPRFDAQIFSGCSRTIRPNTDCNGIARLFVNDQDINRCRKITQTAGWTIPYYNNVKFTL
jgi:hypothetical protein